MNLDPIKELEATPGLDEVVREKINELVRRSNQTRPVQGPGHSITFSDAGALHQLGSISGSLDCETLVVTINGED